MNVPVANPIENPPRPVTSCLRSISSCPGTVLSPTQAALSYFLEHCSPSSIYVEEEEKVKQPLRKKHKSHHYAANGNS